MSEVEINKLMEDCILLEELLISVGMTDIEAANKKAEIVSYYQETYGFKLVNGEKFYCQIPAKQQLEMMEVYYVWAEKRYTELTGKSVQL